MDDDFKKLVERCAKGLENHTIFNASRDHAIILFQNLLEVAATHHRDVKIFSGCFDTSFYDSLVDSIKSVEKEKLKISLISECDELTLKGNKFVDEVRKYDPSQVLGLGKKMGLPHFILVGDSSYRVEMDDALKSAHANFNDPSTGVVLSSLFAQMAQSHAI